LDVIDVTLRYSVGSGQLCRSGGTPFFDPIASELKGFPMLHGPGVIIPSLQASSLGKEINVLIAVDRQQSFLNHLLL
jgi:hypothetical protein